MIRNDKPIKNLGEDALERGRFVDAAFKTIANIKDTSCYIIGLYGKWGTGKTSIIELLKSKFKSNDYYAVYFNPWSFETREAVMIELFKKIYIGVKQEDNLKPKLKQLGKFLKKTADYIYIPKVSIGGAEIDATDTAKGLFKGLGSYLDEEVGLEEQKEEVNQVLRELNKPLIIFIDDVDRLDKDEIKLLFKIVKQTADFDNIRYILSLDEEMVSKSLAASYGGGTEVDGKKFIEKIVQLPLRIPELSTEKKYKYTMGLFQEWQKQNTIVVNENEWFGFTSKLRTIHRYFISTPRDSKRLINAFEFVETSLKGEVNTNDLLLIESIRLFAPSYFQLLLSNPEVLFEGNLNYEGNNSEKKHEEIEKITGLKEAQVEALIAVTSWLFPDHSLPRQKRPLSIHEVYIDDPNEGSVELRKKGLRKNQNIGSKAYFIKYLEFTIGKDQVPDVLFREIIKLFNSKETDLTEEPLRKLLVYTPNIIYDKFSLHAEDLNEYGACNFIKLFYTKPTFCSYFNYSNWRHGTYNKGKRIKSFSLEHFKKISDSELVIRTIKSIVEESASLHAASELLVSILQGYYPQNSEGEIQNIEVKLKIKELTNELIQKILSSSSEVMYEDPIENKGFSITPLFTHQTNASLLREKNILFIKTNAQNAVKYLKSFVPIMFIDEKMYIANNIGHQYLADAETYASREILLNYCKEIVRNINLEVLAANGEIDYRTLSDDESVAVQYYRFVALTPDR